MKTEAERDEEQRKRNEMHERFRLDERRRAHDIAFARAKRNVEALMKYLDEEPW